MNQMAGPVEEEEVKHRMKVAVISFILLIIGIFGLFPAIFLLASLISNTDDLALAAGGLVIVVFLFFINFVIVFIRYLVIAWKHPKALKNISETSPSTSNDIFRQDPLRINNQGSLASNICQVCYTTLNADGVCPQCSLK